ncbi:aspartyl protease family protein [Candidatus Roizmanbacteria bacterium]|nr:aspartyl protease family protein [Candidatus Roizmanbacteria bacterium]
MGVIQVKLTVKNPIDPSKKAIEEFLVDSGAHYTVIPASIVKNLFLKPSFKQDFSLADGRIITRSIGNATIRYESKELTVPVVLGRKGDSPLLGLTTLESFGLMLDPFKRRIYHSRLMLA